MSGIAGLLAPVGRVPHVGPRRAEMLQRLGIATVWQLLFHLPARYQDLGHPTPIDQLQPGETATVRAAVLKTSERRPRGRGHVRSLLLVRLWDGTGQLDLVFFNQKYLKDAFLPEREFYVFGRPELKGRSLQMVSPDFEPAAEAMEHSPVRAIYPLTEGMTQRAMHGLMASALEYFRTWGTETLPEELFVPLRLPPLEKALAMVHTPYAFAKAQGRADDWQRYAQLGRRRLAFEELLYLQLQVQRRRQRVRQVSVVPYGPESEAALAWLPSAFVEGLPFALTGAQQRAIAEIAADLRRDVPMHRLLVGDVGSGKTVVLLYALLYAIAHNDQGALLAPTEVLAEQHFQTVRRLLAHLPVSVSLLTGSTPRLERQGTLWDAGAGHAQLTVGTHAVLEDDLEFRRLRMVVIDEQHKFGVRQRARLVEKGRHPHLLVTSATPIPRTLALTLYGDLELTILDELPPGRQPVETRWIGETHMREVYAEIRRRVEAGGRAFIVCPLIEASDALPDLSPLTSIHEELARRVFPDLPVGCLHGGLPSEEKNAVMAAFADGRLPILVSTTVIEVGVDVPEATLMAILSAERFGLSQLHQLRGRIGRGRVPSICYAVAGEEVSWTARERLEAFTSTNDGFVLAEKDLSIRGPGELLGLRQSGALGFRAADLGRDQELLERARKAALGWLERDPELASPASAPLREMMACLDREVPLSGA